MKRLALFPLVALVLAACQDTAQITQPEAAGSPLFSASAASATSGLTFQSVSAGSRHSCGVTPAGAAFCWGRNDEGQLGDGTFTDRNGPVAVSRGLTFQSVSAGGNHSCGVTPAGAAFCWGLNNAGQLGNGTNANSNVPVAVSGGLTFQSVSAGDAHSCGVTTAEAAFCWGLSNEGQLGNGTSGTFTFSKVPVLVAFTPEQLLDFLIADVQDLIDAGLGNAGGNGLLGILNAALSSIQNGPPSAVFQLNAFIRAVEGFVASGVLTAEQGQALIDAAQTIIDGLTA